MTVAFMIPMSDIQELKVIEPNATSYDQFYRDLLEGENNYFERDCGVSTSFENRKKFRWLFYKSKMSILTVVYDEFGSKAVAIVYSAWHALLVTFTFLLILQSTRILFLLGKESFIDAKKEEFIIVVTAMIYLIYLLYISNIRLSEYTFSLHESFLLSFALYSAVTNRVVLFVLVLSLAVLVRESGFLMVLPMLFLGRVKYAVSSVLVAFLVFTAVNADILHCLSNPEYLINAEKQEGQLTWHTFADGGGGIAKGVWAVIYNFIPFIIPLVMSYRYLSKTRLYTASIFSMYYKMTFIYLFIFIVATPIHHMSVKLLILPLIIPLIVVSFINHYSSKDG